jgi:translation initiation factor IF-2
LLGLASQDAIDLLKKETGIDVKSASSSIEEIVARQFVERQARKRNISLPHGAMFADQTVAKKPAGKPGKAPEPPKAAAPVLRPRLVKAVRPPTEGIAEPSAPAADHAIDAAPAVEEPPVIEAPPAHEPEVHEPEHTPVVEAPAAAVPEVEPEPEPEPVAAEPSVIAEPPPAPKAPLSFQGFRAASVPPTRRLRIEDPVTGEAPAARPVAARPVVRMQQAPPAPTRPAATPPPGSRPSGLRPGSPPARPPLADRGRCLRSPCVRNHQAHRDRHIQAAVRPAASSVRWAEPARARYDATTGRTRRPSGTVAARHQAHHPCRRHDGEGPRGQARGQGQGSDEEDSRPPHDDDDQLDARFRHGAGPRTRLRRRSLDSQLREELTEVETETSNPEDLSTRAPVVTIMGHVDHGKTTLLDAIRETKIAEREAGGITQHIGAYSVDVNGRRVVFLDTPGHEAFTMMRARGAKVTDIVVLVVAADDGVMPQTKEAIDHARAANVPIVVAVNKIDKGDANPERVKRELSDLGLMPEAWGGTTVTVEVSARQRKNLDQLLEMILLVADLADLKANSKRRAMGTVLEAKLDRGRGPVATVLVQDGTLSDGDLFIAGVVDGKVRAMFDHLGRKIKKAGPATPVEVLGLSALPQPGDTFQVIDDPAKARQVVAYRQAQQKEKTLGGKSSRLTLESLQQQMAEGGMKELPLIIKADVQGSSEVLADTLAKLTDERVKVRIIHAGVGAINESDVLLATASNAIIIGFNVRPDRNAAEVAEREKVDIRHHSVIYHVTDEIKKGMAGLLEPTIKETRLGAAEVRQMFKAPKAGTIAGCMVIEGRIARSGEAQARLLRDNVVVWTGKISSLRRFKDDVSEVKSGMECGISLERFNDVKVGDIIEVFSVERIAQTV